MAHIIGEENEQATAVVRRLSARQTIEEIRRVVGDGALDIIYRDRVLSGRSRQYSLPRANSIASVEIIHTLLGIELKVGKRRLLCPDYATARYLSIFARLGGGEVAVPYDITGISTIADEMESSLQRMLLLADLLTRERSLRFRASVRKGLAQDINTRISQLGSGARFPEFTPPRRSRRK